MKKAWFIVVVVVLGLMLSACGGSSTDDTSGSTDGTGAQSGALSPELELLIGTMQLEDTEQAVDAAQAAELLPLWKAYLALQTSGTSAVEERDAVVKQIKEVMTAEQLQAIDDMDLTMASMQEVMASYRQEIGTPSAGQEGEGFVFRYGDGESGWPSGGDFAGGPPAGGFGPGGAGEGGGVIINPGEGGGFQGGGTFGEADPEMMATMQARRQQGGGTMGVNPMLLQALISMLEQKIG
jgi:hypothetical protein